MWRSSIPFNIEERIALINQFYLEYYKIKIEKELNIKEIKFNTEGKNIKLFVEFAKKIRDNDYSCKSLIRNGQNHKCWNSCPLNGFIPCWNPTIRKNLIDFFIMKYEPTIETIQNNNVGIMCCLKEKCSILEQEIDKLKYEYDNLQIIKNNLGNASMEFVNKIGELEQKCREKDHIIDSITSKWNNAKNEVNKLKEICDYKDSIIEKLSTKLIENKNKDENYVHVLKLGIDNCYSLCLYYDVFKNGCLIYSRIIGFINIEGECHFNNDNHSLDEWKKHNGGYSSDIIEWRNGIYKLCVKNNALFLTRVDIENGNVYDVTNDFFLYGCRDNNIIVNSGLKPIRFSN